jgi:hypothetical protein
LWYVQATRYSSLQRPTAITAKAATMDDMRAKLTKGPMQDAQLLGRMSIVIMSSEVTEWRGRAISMWEEDVTLGLALGERGDR